MVGRIIQIAVSGEEHKIRSVFVQVSRLVVFESLCVREEKRREEKRREGIDAFALRLL